MTYWIVRFPQKIFDQVERELGRFTVLCNPNKCLPSLAFNDLYRTKKQF